ncbi:MAG: hypothetical protein NC210_09955 [[Clostridium] fimetarium]|nr:hypothetical protein [Alistipes timonensis]MCM1406734.1 hypothetical protein [[Clostridium] fimetarium]
MSNGFVITPHVLNTINSLPEQERLSIVCTLAGEMLLGIKRDEGLSPMEKVIYSIIRQYIERDTERVGSLAV